MALFHSRYKKKELMGIFFYGKQAMYCDKMKLLKHVYITYLYMYYEFPLFLNGLSLERTELHIWIDLLLISIKLDLVLVLGKY